MVKTDDLEIGEMYKLTFPDESIIVAEYVEELRYPATGMPPDYLFKYHSGDDRLPNASGFDEKRFPIPAMLMPQLKIEKM